MFLFAAVNAIQGPVIYVYMSDSPQDEAHPFWSEINSQPEVAAAHYMAHDVDDRHHYAAQPEEYFWVKAGIRSDRLHVTQSAEGSAQDPVISSTGEHASQGDLSHSVSQMLFTSSSPDEQNVEAEWDRVDNNTYFEAAIEVEATIGRQQDRSDAASSAVKDSPEHVEAVSEQANGSARPRNPVRRETDALLQGLMDLAIGNNPRTGSAGWLPQSSAFPNRSSILNLRRYPDPDYDLWLSAARPWRTPRTHLPVAIRELEIIYRDGRRDNEFYFGDVVMKYRSQADVNLTRGYDDLRVYLDDFVTIGVPLQVFENFWDKLLSEWRVREGDLRRPREDCGYAWIDIKLFNTSYTWEIWQYRRQLARKLLPLKELIPKIYLSTGKEVRGRARLSLRVNHVEGREPNLGGTLWGFECLGTVDIRRNSPIA